MSYSLLITSVDSRLITSICAKPSQGTEADQVDSVDSWQALSECLSSLLCVLVNFSLRIIYFLNSLLFLDLLPFTSAAVGLFDSHDDVSILNSKNFDSAIHQNEAAMVNFYASWCKLPNNAGTKFQSDLFQVPFPRLSLLSIRRLQKL